MELNELTNNLCLAEHFRDGENEVGCGDAWLEGTSEVNAYDIRGEEVHRLPQHPRLGFNSANAPADDSDAIDHGCVGVGTYEGVWVEEAIFGGKHALCEVLEVYLVDDTNAWWDDAECVKGLHPPLHELVALCVALEFNFHVAAESFRALGHIDLDGVVYDEVNGNKWFDDAGVFAERIDCAAHRRHVYEERNASEVLKDHTGYHKWNFIGPLCCGAPVCQCVDIGFGNALAIAVAENRLKYDPD